MQPESHQVQYYIKGSGTSACLLTGKLDDSPQFIPLSILDTKIVDIQLSGLFAIAIIQQPSPTSSPKPPKLLKWGNLNEHLLFTPTIVQLSPYKPIRRISCGWNHALMVTEDGVLLGLGQNKYGQLGNRNQGKFFEDAVVVVEGEGYRVEVIAAGFRQSYWVTTQNTVYGCGQSKNNELGKTNKKSVLPQTALQFQSPNSQKITKISCGKKFLVLLNQTGQVYGLGSNDYKCLSQKQINSFEKFAKIGQGIKDIECGWSHLVLLDRQGQIWTRGRNNFGQLGRKEGQDGRVGLGEKCVQIKVGTQFSFAHGDSGTLYGWGWNQHMNIINKAQCTVIETPVIVDTPAGFKPVSCFTYPAITILRGFEQNR